MNNSISLTMIVKNEAQHLADCLQSVKNVVDEIIIVDTGSTDSTIEIADSFNAKIFHFDWINDFSAARNFALSKSNCNWILYLDADEELYELSRQELLKLSESTDKIGFYCTVKSIDDFSKKNNTIRYVRFFKNSECIKFRGKVHEQITDSLIENNYRLVHSNVEIIHHGYNIPEKDKTLKAERNLNLLLQEYSNNKTPYIAFQIAQSYFILKNYNEAEKFFKAALSYNSLSKDLQSESYYYLAQICHNNFDIEGSEKNIKTALSLNNSKPFHQYLYAKILHRKQDFLNALKSYKKALELNRKSEIIQKQNLQTVFLDEYETIFAGINLAFKLNQKEFLEYFINQLSIFVKNNFKSQIDRYNLLIKILKEKKVFNKDDFDFVFEIIDKDNLEIILQVIDLIKNSSLKIELLERIYNRYLNEIEVIKKLALVYDSVNLTHKSINLFNIHKEQIEEDPTALLYFSSFCIKKNELEKALSSFELIERKFPQIFSLNPKVKEIKERVLVALKT